MSQKLHCYTHCWNAIQRDSELVVFDKTKMATAKGSRRHSTDSKKDGDPCWRESSQAAKSIVIAFPLSKNLTKKQRGCKNTSKGLKWQERENS